MAARLGSLLFAALAATPPAMAGEVALRPDDSLLAIVTHKAGFAAGKAHDHLIAAAGYRARLELDPDAPEGARFELEAPAADLRVDDAALQEAWFPRLEQLGVLDEPFSGVSDKDRRKVRKTMLGEDQLAAGQFPTLTARVVAVEEKPRTVGGVEFPYTVRLALEVRGKTVEQPVAVRYEVEDGALVVEALGTFRFTDFGIEPYSAFLGAVKNQDEIHLYLHLEGDL